MSQDSRTEDLLRELAPQILGVLTRRYGDFDAAEDAVQEALLAASLHWPESYDEHAGAGLSDHPGGQAARRERSTPILPRR